MYNNMLLYCSSDGRRRTFVGDFQWNVNGTVNNLVTWSAPQISKRVFIFLVLSVKNVAHNGFKRIILFFSFVQFNEKPKTAILYIYLSNTVWLCSQSLWQIISLCPTTPVWLTKQFQFLTRLFWSSQWNWAHLLWFWAPTGLLIHVDSKVSRSMVTEQTQSANEVCVSQSKAPEQAS